MKYTVFGESHGPAIGVVLTEVPSGIPVATVAVNGSKNAGLLAISILALGEPALAEKLKAFRAAQREKILKTTI